MPLSAESFGQSQRIEHLEFLPGGKLHFLFRFNADPRWTARRYNVFMDAHNGSFTQSIILAKRDNTWQLAEAMSATYNDGITGPVWRVIAMDFPSELLAKYTDWANYEKLPKVDVAKLDSIHLTKGMVVQQLDPVGTGLRQ